MAFNTFSGRQTQSSLQVIQYEGPPKPKQLSKQPLKIPSQADRGVEEGITTTSDEVDFVNLTRLDDIEGNGETSGSGIECVKLQKGRPSCSCSMKVYIVDSLTECSDVGNDDGRKYVSTPVSREDRGDKNPCPPELSKSYSQETAVVIDDSQSDSEADASDPWKEGSSPPVDDCLRVCSASTPHCNEEEVNIGTIDLINSKIIDRPKTQAASKLLYLESTPPTSPSIENVKQSKQERPTKKQVERNIRLPTVGIVCSGSTSESDTDGDNHDEKFTKLLTRKRKTTTPANNASHKRQNRGLDSHSARRKEPTLSRKRQLSYRNSDTKLDSGAQYSGCDTGMLYGDDSSDESSGESDNRDHYHPKGLKPIATRQASVLCSPRSNSPSKPALPHAIRKQNRSEKCILPGKAQWHLSDIAFHSLPVDMSFLTALFRGYSSSGILSSSCAVKLLENVMGRAIKLKDVTIKLLTPGMWLLTGLVDCNSDVAETGTGQTLSTLSSLHPNTADAAPARQHGRPSYDVDDETSSDDSDINGDKNDEHSSDIINESLSSRKHSRWSKQEENCLRIWKEEGKPWEWIYRQFPNRSPGAVKLRWHTKFRGKA